MKRFLLNGLAIVCLCYGALAVAATPATVKSFIDDLATQVLTLVRDQSIPTEVKTQKIEALFSDKVDINFVAQFALGKYWREATPQQRTDYIAAYKPFILKNYASRLTRYSGQTYTLKNARNEGDVSIVTMEIIDPNGQNVMVEYRLREGGEGKFKIVDIIVEGVSLLTTQRTEFSSIVDQKGIDGLIDALKTQVASRH